MVYKLGIFSSFEVDDEVDFRKKFIINYKGAGEYFLVSRASIKYDNKLFKVCVRIQDKYYIEDAGEYNFEVGNYIINIVLVPCKEYVNRKTIKDIIKLKYSHYTFMERMLESYVYNSVCVTMYDLYSYGLVLPLCNTLDILLDTRDIKMLGEDDIEVLDTPTMKYQLNSIAYLEDYFRLMSNIIVTALDDDIKEYVLNNLIDKAI